MNVYGAKKRRSIRILGPCLPKRPLSATTIVAGHKKRQPFLTVAKSEICISGYLATAIIGSPIAFDILDIMDVLNI